MYNDASIFLPGKDRNIKPVVFQLSQMRIIYLTGRERTYSRNDVILRAFQRWGDVEVYSPERRGSILLSSIRLYLKALPALARSKYDLIFCGFYGHLMMLPAGILRRSPILFDAFVSTYDTLCFDRNIVSPNSLPGKTAFFLDKIACGLADSVLLDTQQHIQYFQSTFKLNNKRYKRIPVGCNEDLFHPVESLHNKEFVVLYYCSYLPLHGVDIVVKAASILRDKRISFRLIGSGQEYKSVRALALQLKLTNITWVPDVPLEQLPKEIAKTDVCLGGHFGSSIKAERVIPGKIYQMLAMGSPVIAGDTPANRELLENNQSALLCNPGDPQALASAILNLYQDPGLKTTLMKNGHQVYTEKCSEAVITMMLRNAVCEIIE
jgi:glycosyltransferase involved in cell wall biosynthesis